jgi:hypothetical protein
LRPISCFTLSWDSSVSIESRTTVSQKRVETLDGPTNTTRVWEDGHVVRYDAGDNTVFGKIDEERGIDIAEAILEE